MENFERGSITLEFSKENLEICGRHLRAGHLVAFPTETVYGLGANALDSKAIIKIFKAKERPLNDPVIVHVISFETVKKLICPSISLSVHSLIKKLVDKFWPGPLTIVLKCNDKVVPKEITGGTGCVGIRYPRNRVSQELIRVSGTPIAAPSANKFGHVSPTSYRHVEEDLGDTEFPIFILKDEEIRNCEVGIESTVCKITDKGEKGMQISVLRKGGTSTHSLKEFVKELNEKEEELKISLTIKSKIIKNDSKKGMKSPGQLITHYSPNIPSYLIENFVNFDLEVPKDFTKSLDLRSIVVIDFKGKYFEVKDKFMQYYDLSKDGNTEEVATVLFKLLRLSEKVEGASALILPNLKGYNLEHLDACHDRLYRAASGKLCYLTEKNILYK